MYLIQTPKFGDLPELPHAKKRSGKELHLEQVDTNLDESHDVTIAGPGNPN
jgi:hypothetical protein